MKRYSKARERSDLLFGIVGDGDLQYELEHRLSVPADVVKPQAFKVANDQARQQYSVGYPIGIHASELFNAGRTLKPLFCLTGHLLQNQGTVLQ